MAQSRGNTSKCHEIPIETPIFRRGAAPRTPRKPPGRRPGPPSRQHGMHAWSGGPVAAPGNRVFCSQHLQVCNAYITGSPSPAVQATSRAQFMHTSHRTLHVRAKGGWVHVRAAGGARRTGAFERPEADEVRSAGARSPSSAGTPFAVTGGHLALF
eukprot:288672-Prymnesium_polylepis.1